ncbi:TATA box-binding protein-like protein 1-like [Scleropages formosus]|uniref:TATA box-binding protein-like protein 1-like n=1 Tax=Scleropages formosus TaxID=113540 RepID=A0A0P7TF70_SCLFO|nr:TATA box-binding protein-like protein 1-like [Scleropages formosus]
MRPSGAKPFVPTTAVMTSKMNVSSSQCKLGEEHSDTSWLRGDLGREEIWKKSWVKTSTPSVSWYESVRPRKTPSPMEPNNDVALDIIITNVVAVFRTRCHLNLRTIAREGSNVIYKPEVGSSLLMLYMCPLSSEEEAKLGARRLARCLQKLGFKVKFTDYKVVNVLAVCTMPFQIQLIEFTKNNRPIASYEPELHPAASYRIKNLKATVQIFSTGSITVTGTSVPGEVQVGSSEQGVERTKTFPLVKQCRLKYR